MNIFGAAGLKQPMPFSVSSVTGSASWLLGALILVQGMPIAGIAPSAEASQVSQGMAQAPQTELEKPIAPSTLAPSTISQVTITEKTDRLTWGDPTRSEPGYREAKLRIPLISGIADRTLLKQIQNAVSLKTLFGKSLEEMRADYADEHWLTRLDYRVNYNANSLLHLTYFGEGLGAYPSQFERHIAVNLNTGRVLRSHDLFKTQSLGILARQVDEKMQLAIREKMAKLAEDMQDIGDQRYKEHRFRVRHLDNFIVTPEGVTFSYDYDFPHVIRAAEPEGKFSFTYAELQPFIKPKGAIAALISQ
jgi:hypothetical protein